ncbi:lipopolysaccharide biosynthesis protein [Holdemania massiliensis]|nr:oligosaccharide flippase family protein [Holdemania massiliensis]
MKNFFLIIKEKYNALSTILKASIWFFACTFLQKGISVLTTPIFTRLMLPSEYGVVSTYLSVSDLMSILITLGLASSVYQKKVIQIEDSAERNRFTSSLQGLATTTAIISFIFYLFNHKWINSLIGLPSILILSVFPGVLSVTAFGFWSMLQRTEYRYVKLVQLTLATSLAKPIVGIIAILLWPQNKVYSRVLSLVLVEVISYTYLYIKCFWDGKCFYDKKYWKYALRFVLPLIPHYFFQRILLSSSQLMIKRMVGNYEAGIYSIGNSVGWVLTLLVTALDYTMAPWTYQKLKERKTVELGQFVTIPIALMAAFCLILISFAPEIVSVFAPSAYHDAIWVIPPIVMCTYFMLVYTFFIYFEYYYEQTSRIMLATAISGVLCAILNYVFIRIFGYLAAAYATLICYILYTFFHYLIYRNICFKEFGACIYNGKIICVISILLIALSLTITFFYNHLLIRIGIASVIVIGIILNYNAFMRLVKKD